MIIGFWGPLYCDDKKEPTKIVQVFVVAPIVGQARKLPFYLQR